MDWIFINDIGIQRIFDWDVLNAVLQISHCVVLMFPPHHFVQVKKMSRSEEILDTLQTTSEARASSKPQHSDRVLKYSRAKQLFSFGEPSISGNGVVFSKKWQLREKNIFCRAKTGDPSCLWFCAGDSASNQPSTLTNHHLLESHLSVYFFSRHSPNIYESDWSFIMTFWV